MEYCIYGMNNEIPAILETARIKHRSAFSCFKAFGFGREEMYHTLNGGGRTVYRNPYLSALDGYSSDRYLSLYNVLDDGDAALPGSDADHPCAGAVYRNIRIWRLAPENP